MIVVLATAVACTALILLLAAPADGRSDAQPPVSPAAAPVAVHAGDEIDRLITRLTYHEFIYIHFHFIIVSMGNEWGGDGACISISK